MNAIDYATEIVKKLTTAGYTAYFAGGWVRDHLMRHPSADIDIATDAPPRKVLDLFPRTILVGLAFGVVIVPMGGYQFEVATFRKDFGYTDGRKPDTIEFAEPEEDAQRRDFTINGMFYDPLNHIVHDFVQGVADLQRGMIRAIGNPYERFLEDRLRMIRAVRFANRFAFAIDPDTQEAIVANADTLFPAVAKERVWMEFAKMAEGGRFGHALVDMHRLGLLSTIFPELEGVHLNEIRQRTIFFPQFPVGTPISLYLCELFPQASLNALIDIFKGLHVSNQELGFIEAMIKARPLLREEYHPEAVEWAHFYAHKHTPLLIQMEAARHPSGESDAFLQKQAYRKAQLKAHIDRIVLKKPLVTAAQLKEYGIPSGIEMGMLLKEAERLTVNQDMEDPNLVLQHLQKSPLWPTKELL